jgi:hypothetical protein
MREKKQAPERQRETSGKLSIAFDERVTDESAVHQLQFKMLQGQLSG